MPLPAVTLIAVPIIGAIGLVVTKCLEGEKRKTIKTRYDGRSTLLAIIAIASAIIALIVNTSAYIVTLVAGLLVGGFFYCRRS